MPTDDDVAAVEQIGDPTLVKAAQAGDVAAMNQLLRRHFDHINRLCLRMLAEAWFQAARRISTFDGRASFSTWLHAIAKNACLNDIRSCARRPTVELDPDQAGRYYWTSPQEAIADRLDVEAAMTRVTPVYRDVLVLWFYGDMSYKDIAQWLEIELNTVRTRLLRGKEQLKQLLLQQRGEASEVSDSHAPRPATAPGPALDESRR
jgi:RNA polymerase sigma-70 factor (ECF subfamily)